MTIKRNHWILFGILSVISIAIWRIHTYPQFSFLDLSVDRNRALEISRAYLAEEFQADPNQYLNATTFSGRQSADRYLQKALAFSKVLEFFETHDFELFFWKTRFFKENQEEQFFITVSARTGEVTHTVHHIPATAIRTDHGKEEAKKFTLQFLRDRFSFNPQQYELLTDLAKIHDNRTDYTFEWGRKDVFIPWNDNPVQDGGARLLNSVTVSGDEVLSFTKEKLKIPESFNRHISRIQNTGRNLGVIFRYCFFALLSASIFVVIGKHNSILLHTIKMPCIAIAAALFCLEIALYFNGFNIILFNYPTTSTIASYLWRVFSQTFLQTFMVSITVIMPFLAGEVLHHEVFLKKREKTLFHHIQSTFFSRNVTSLILLGYLTGIIMLGMQSVLFYFGKKYFGVWTEYRWMTNSSGGFFPFLPGFVVALTASLSEETMFRLFGISLGKKILKNTFLAVLLSSLIWGYAHVGYPVYPMWFRGMEVTCLGIFLAYVFLEFGLIPVLTAHYFFDAFWGASNFIFGKSSPVMFYSGLVIIMMPAIFAVFAFAMNQKEQERCMRWRLSIKQKFNLIILKYYLKDHPVPANINPEDYQRKIIDSGWDSAVVETAFEEP